MSSGTKLEMFTDTRNFKQNEKETNYLNTMPEGVLKEFTVISISLLLYNEF